MFAAVIVYSGLSLGVRIRVVLARLELREPGLRGRGDAAIPRGNGAVGVAGLLAAQRRELGAELGGFGAPTRPPAAGPDQHARQHRQPGQQ